MPETPVLAESPNGDVILPQWAVRPLTLLVIVAGSISALLPDGIYQRVAVAIVAVGAGLGIYSGGARK